MLKAIFVHDFMPMHDRLVTPTKPACPAPLQEKLPLHPLDTRAMVAAMHDLLLSQLPYGHMVPVKFEHVS